jgi:hypothetical protein
VVPKEFQKITYPEVFKKKKITGQHWSDPLPFLGFIREKIPALYPYLYAIKIRIFVPPDSGSCTYVRRYKAS